MVVVVVLVAFGSGGVGNSCYIDGSCGGRGIGSMWWRW